MNAKKVAPILLIAVLALAAVGVMIKASKDRNVTGQSGSNSAPAQQTQQPQQTQQVPRQTQEQASQAGPDTVVPEGMTPDEFVQKYYDAVIKKDYQTAYDMQPASKKASANLESFKSTQESYGISSFAVDKAEVQGDAATVKAKLELGQYGTWTSIWQFSKKNGKWVAVSSRTGMAQ